MNNDFQNIFHMMRSVRLTSHEKLAMRAAVLRRAGIAQGGARAVGARPSIFGIEFRRRTIVAGSVIGALLLGSTMSYAAEGALPGDVLYPVKISVNERVREAFAQSNKDKAVLETQLASRRLEETERLAILGRLSTTTQVALEARATEHITKAEAYRTRVEEEGDTVKSEDLTSDIEATLSAHHEALNTLAEQEQDTEVKQQITKLAVVLGNRAAQTARARSHEDIRAIGAKVSDMEIGSNSTTTATTTAAYFMEKDNEKQSARKKKYVENLERKLNISIHVATTSRSDGSTEGRADNSTTTSSTTEAGQTQGGTPLFKDREQRKKDPGVNIDTPPSPVKQEGSDEGPDHGNTNSVDNLVAPIDNSLR